MRLASTAAREGRPQTLHSSSPVLCGLHAGGGCGCGWGAHGIADARRENRLCPIYLTGRACRTQGKLAIGQLQSAAAPSWLDALEQLRHDSNEIDDADKVTGQESPSLPGVVVAQRIAWTSLHLLHIGEEPEYFTLRWAVHGFKPTCCG